MIRSHQLPFLLRGTWSKVLWSFAYLNLGLRWPGGPGSRNTWFSLAVTCCPLHRYALIFGSKPAPIASPLRCPVDGVPFQAHHERRGGARFFSPPASVRMRSILGS